MTGLPDPLFADDLSTLYVGEALSILQQLPDASVDVVLTDPPYSSGGMMRGDRAGSSTMRKYQSNSTRTRHRDFSGDSRDQRAFLAWCVLWLEEIRRITKPGAIVACFSDWRQMPTMTDALQVGGLVWRGVVPWVKKGPRPQMGRWAAGAEYLVWGTNGPRPLAGPCLPGAYTYRTPPRRRHLTEKPLDLMADLCAIAYEDDAVILDPFTGSASTLVAARSLGIRSIGIEIDPVIAEIAVERLNEPVQSRIEAAS
ncbi:MAG: DNA methyltransferase [Acidobacteriota bacterium]